MTTTKPTDEFDGLLNALRKVYGVPNVERGSMITSMKRQGNE